MVLRADPIFPWIPKGVFSWKINTFTSMCLSIDHFISFFLVHRVLFQSIDSTCLLFLESFLKLYLKVVFLSVPIFQLSASGIPFMCLLDTLFYLTYMLFPHSSFTHLVYFHFICSVSHPVFHSLYCAVSNRSFYCVVTKVYFISLMVLVFHPLLFFLFLLLLLPLSLFSELL